MSTSEWATLSPLSLRQDVVAAFSHNNLVYVIRWQRETKTVVHCFDPLRGEWTREAEALPGTFRPGMLLRRQHLSEAFFASSQLLNV